MIWIVSKKVCGSEQELAFRHRYIEDVTQANVSPWVEQACDANLYLPPFRVLFYQCRSSKGEYGVVITAHIGEVQQIIERVLTDKRALVIVNSCILKKSYKDELLGIVKNSNSQSDLLFAKQEKSDSGQLVNYVDNVGEFGFKTSISERELFRHRKEGLVKAIRLAYERVMAG